MASSIRTIDMITPAFQAGFVDKKIVTQQTIGEMVSKAREGVGKTLDELAAETHIRACYLEALEHGEYEKIQGEVYIKNYLIQYARALGLNADILMGKYQHERCVWEGTTGKMKKIDHISWRQSVMQILLAPSMIRKACIGFVIILFVGYLSYQLYGIVKPPILVLSSPETDMVTVEHTLYVSGYTEKEAKIFVNDQAIAVDHNGQFAEAVDLQDGLNVLEISAQRKHSRNNRVVKHILVESSDSGGLY